MISGKDFTVLREKTGGSVDLGWSGVHSAGDVNQDGVPDLVLGYRDQALVLSGTDLSTIHAVTGSFSATSGGADIDLDGYPDFALGMQNSIGYIPGQVAAYSGKTGALLWTDDGEQNGDDFGFSIDVVGDANGDGFADVVAGAPDNSYIKLISGNPSPWAVLGGDRGGTHGKPRLRGVGFPSSGIPVEITLKQALENSIAVFIGSLLPVSKRLPSGGTLIPQVHIVGVASTGPIGELDITVPWPAEPASVTHWVQVLILDAQAPGGYSISNAITVTSQ
ncbi:MAG: VCBS repeat-containing protein [Planctomycetota bacterium]